LFLQKTKLLTKKTNEFAALVVSLDSLIESPNDIVASRGLPSTEHNANPAPGEKLLDFVELVVRQKRER